ncbi:MAG: hypothetical protein Q8N59_02225 [bacterium]|nr:hypothetical protein [bacterium]
MKNLILIISATIILILPINSLAQFDYLDNMINEDEPEESIGIEETTTANEETPNLISIDMIWSANSYVPYDYPGRALAPEGGFVDVDVVMELSGGRPENLEFSWFIDDNFEESKSGYGKTSFRFGIRRMSGATHTVLVKIFNESRSFYLEESITIPVVNLEVIIYPSPKNKNFSEQAKKNIVVTDNKEFFLVAKPFYFSAQKPTELSYRWDFSDKEAITSSDYGANILKVILPEKFSGTMNKSIFVLAANNKNSIQKAYKNLRIEIQATQSQ